MAERADSPRHVGAGGNAGENRQPLAKRLRASQLRKFGKSPPMGRVGVPVLMQREFRSNIVIVFTGRPSALQHYHSPSDTWSNIDELESSIDYAENFLGKLAVS